MDGDKMKVQGRCGGGGLGAGGRVVVQLGVVGKDYLVDPAKILTNRFADGGNKPKSNLTCFFCSSCCNIWFVV